MRMVPPSPHATGSQAEKRIFERLRTAFDDRYTAFHSLKPTRHPTSGFRRSTSSSTHGSDKALICDS